MYAQRTIWTKKADINITETSVTMSTQLFTAMFRPVKAQSQYSAPSNYINYLMFVTQYPISWSTISKPMKFKLAAIVMAKWHQCRSASHSVIPKYKYQWAIQNLRCDAGYFLGIIRYGPMGPCQWNLMGPFCNEWVNFFPIICTFVNVFMMQQNNSRSK